MLHGTNKEGTRQTNLNGRTDGRRERSLFSLLGRRYPPSPAFSSPLHARTFQFPFRYRGRNGVLYARWDAIADIWFRSGSSPRSLAVLRPCVLFHFFFHSFCHYGFVLMVLMHWGVTVGMVYIMWCYLRFVTFSVSHFMVISKTLSVVIIVFGVDGVYGDQRKGLCYGDALF